MASQIINLKNASENEPSNEDRSERKPEYQEKTFLRWSAHENVAHDKGPYWFLIPGGVALLFVLFGIFTRSYFFIAFVVIAFLVLMLYSNKTPRSIHFEIAPEGVSIDGKFHKMAEFKSFWIFNKPNLKELSLETSSLLYPFIHLPLGGTDPRDVKRVLGVLLPEQEHKEFLSDHLARFLGI